MADDGKRAALDLDSLLDRVRDVLPDLRWRTARLLASGWDHEVVLLDEVLVLRFPNEPYYLDLLAVEIEVLAALRGRTLAALPDYTVVASDGTVAGYPFVAGEALTAEVLARADARAPGAIAAQLAEALTVLHRSEGVDLSRVPAAEDRAWHDELRGIAADRLPAVLSRSELRTVDAVIEQVDELLTAPAPARVLLHGDVYEDHLLWDAEHARLGLIDFSDLCLGDPARDFAEIGDVAPGFREQVIDRYDGPKDDRLLERAEIWGRWVAVFMMTEYLRVEPAGVAGFAEARTLFDRLHHRLAGR